MPKRPSIVAALAREGGGTRRELQEIEPAAIVETPARKERRQQPNRKDKVPIGGFFPETVRDQLKLLAIELKMKRGKKTTSTGLLAEALNDLFAKYGKPEIVPVNHEEE